MFETLKKQQLTNGISLDRFFTLDLDLRYLKLALLQPNKYFTSQTDVEIKDYEMEAI